MGDRKFMKNRMLKLIFVVFLFAAMSHVTFASDTTYNETYCRSCHGVTADRHHLLVVNGTHQCTDCHAMKYDSQKQTYYPEVIRNCLICHSSQIHFDCISCHSPADVNISLFAGHSNINTSDGVGNVTNNDCWTCHYQKDMFRSNIYLCESCHINNSGIVPITDPSLIKSDFMHDSTECRTCHAPIGTGYHLKGTVGPLGVVENILKKMLSP
jgi:hypothetical protein